MYFLNNEGFNCYGIDISETAIAHCEEEFGDRVFVSDFVDIPFEDNFFDLVIDRSSVQHNSPQEIQDIFIEVYRVLRLGGRFFSSMVGSPTCSVEATCLSEEVLRKYLSDFRTINIDFVLMSKNNRHDLHLTYLIDALK